MANLIASYGGAEPIHCLAWGGDIVTPNPPRPTVFSRRVRAEATYLVQH